MMFNFVCFSINNWEKRKARKQQFMMHLALREDVDKVFYIEPPLNFWRLLFELNTPENRSRWGRALSFRIRPIDNKLFLFTPVFFIPFSFRLQFIYNLNLWLSTLLIKFKLRKLMPEETVLWLYHPYDYPILKWFKNRLVSVFDWAEEWAVFFTEFDQRGRNKIYKLEEQIIKGSDIVFTTGPELQNKAKKYNDNSFRMLDGAIYEVFQQKPDVKPNDIKSIKGPIAGYFGTINQRLDIELLKSLSEQFSDLSVVMVGDVHRMDISIFKDYKNIHFIGGKQYKELGNYAYFFDLCILPYTLSSSLTETFPTKIFDYLATGKPIVAINYGDLSAYKEVLYLASSRKEFLELVKKVLSGDDGLGKIRLEVARDNTWDKRAQQIRDIIKREVNK